MAAESTNDDHYSRYVHTNNWAVLDRAITDLVRNSELTESTSHEYVIGFLCEALAEPAVRIKPRGEELRQIVYAARSAVRAANPTNRDLVAELLAERREEAARE